MALNAISFLVFIKLGNFSFYLSSAFFIKLIIFTLLSFFIYKIW